MKNFITLSVLLLFISAADANTASVKHDQTVKKADDQAMTTQKATDLTRMIREKIVADDTLSVKAHNIQIITDNSNRVILKGNVDSTTEKKKVESIAKSVAGSTQVINNTVVTK